MKRSMKWAAAFLGIALFAVPLMACNAGGTKKVSALSTTAAEATSTKNTIVTSGVGNIIMKPDSAVIILGIVTDNEKAAAAAEQNAKDMNSIIDALKKAGVKEDSIETSGYNINMVYDYSGMTPKANGYQVRNSLSVKLDDVDKVSEILDTAVAAGANEVQSVQFTAKDSKEQYDKALEAAVADAKAKAEVLAKAAGIKGNLVVSNITEASYNNYSPYAEYSKVAAADGAGATPILPSNLTINAGVTVTFTFN